MFADYRQGQGKGCVNRVRLSVCVSVWCALNLHNVGFKKSDFRSFVYIFQVQNSRNVLEFSVKLKLHNVAFKQHTIGLRATLPCRCNLAVLFLVYYNILASILCRGQGKHNILRSKKYRT